ncbi:hypothetical protein QJS10_CPB22g01182 [Acorus calamus]|uniref:AAA+ ATPase domain-containing protein n=1 Tax=Acorus calamus TaxID=4465 RepID=A0AAV9C2G4_ACOCL|nr:hypothetical protein QJS10_CPB22g01182 [Acorus calamus]
MNEIGLAGLGSTLASLMFLWAVAGKYFPFNLEDLLRRRFVKFTYRFYPYIHVSFPEFTGEHLKRSEAYSAIESYLMSTSTSKARSLRAELGKDSSNLVFSMGYSDEVTDDFDGGRVRVWWSSTKSESKTPTFSIRPAPQEHRFFKLTFHHRHRDTVMERYLKHVLESGKAALIKNQQRRLYTNNPNRDYDYRMLNWSHVIFEHPASFDTLAMHPDKKREIIEDLKAFKAGKEYYARIGKAWKRGYLLYGPPGTGKSTMIAAMANYLDYDIYDLELTAVKDNSALRKLLIETTGKSIIVIEDIDCSLDLSGNRKKKEEKTEEEKQKESLTGKPKEEASKVTLSGLLNFIDGLWSACGGERIIVFTTNYVEKLDPALIRRGRMDKHIELSYCNFEGFKVFAKNYLGIENHMLFETIQRLLGEVQITPADVAESLMTKTSSRGVVEDANACLEDLIQALEKAKEDATIRAVEKAKEDAIASKEEVEDGPNVEKQQSGEFCKNEKASD